MDPIQAMMGGMSLVGLAMSAFGTSSAASDAKGIAQASSAIGGLDEQVNGQRQQQMLLQSNRAQLQNVRNSQMARATALTGATSQGAQFGTGLQGGYGQIEGEANTNSVNNSQNLQIGQNIFGLDNQIDQQRMTIAQLQGQQASSQGMSALGGDITKAAPAFSQIFGNFFGGPSAGATNQGNAGGTSGWGGNGNFGSISNGYIQ